MTRTDKTTPPTTEPETGNNKSTSWFARAVFVGPIVGIAYALQAGAYVVDALKSGKDSSQVPADRGANAKAEEGLPITRQQALELLNLRDPVTDKEIKIAYRSMIMKWHPDRLEGMAEHLKQIATERLKRINAAYEILEGAR